MADGWVQAVVAPPVGQGRDLGQVGAPVNAQLQAAQGHALVVSTSGPLAVQVTYQGGGDGTQSPRVWLDVGTWSLRLPAPISSVVVSPAPGFVAAPHASVWIDTNPPERAC